MLANEIIRRVKEIQIRTGRQVADVLAGEYISVFKGGGIEFDEVRPYVPGDDIRTIDWNVTARTGAPFVKRFQEERQLSLMLMADISASHDFGSGTRSKRETAAELCALLAFSAIRNDDKVGLILFHGGIEQYIPPRKGQKHALRVVREVLAHGETDARRPKPEAFSLTQWWQQIRKRWSWRPGKTLRSAEKSTDINQAMEFFMSVSKRKTVCFLVSDFIDHHFERAVMAANRKHDVIAVLITDARESHIPNVGLIALQDAETAKTKLYDTGSEAFRQHIAQTSAQRIANLETKLRASRIDFIHIDAAGSIVDPLVRFFRMRERRMKR